MKRLYLVIVGLLLVASYVVADERLDSLRKEMPLDLDFSYTGDVAGNAHGGIKKGVGYLGYLSVAVHFSTEKAGWWKGGELCVGGGNTHGCTPSESWLGDHQVADNIEAGNHTFMEQLWIRQAFWHMALSVGLQDMNADYAVCDKAGYYLNSSFGIHSTMGTNFDAPIFPLTALGVKFQWQIKDDWLWQAAVYDTPLQFEENPYNVKWQLNAKKGFWVIAEGQWTPTLCEDLDGAYKLGGYCHTAEKVFGFYLTAEQTVWRNERHTVECFLQAAVAPQKKYDNWAHMSGGVNLLGIFSKKQQDAMGVAFTTACIASPHHHETALEWFYRYSLWNEHIYFQPDLQYIIHPCAEGEISGNALFLALRMGIEF